MPLLEFVVDGPPVSQQARRQERLREWKNVVRQSAKRYWPDGSPLLVGPTKIVIIYFYEGASLDTDNIVKPIQDALIGLVYNDDHQITDVICRKRRLNSSFRIENLSPVLAEGFTHGNEFLYIQVDEALNQEELY
jgi:crossover junction endodeoxyribonuclease RusA